MKDTMKTCLCGALGLLLLSSAVNGCKELPARSGRAAPPPSAAAPAYPHRKTMSVVGVLVAYGNEPRVTWMIRAEDGKLYFPKGELQGKVAGIPVGTYEWRGEIEAPVSLPGLIPAHEAAFVSLSWKKVAD